VIHRLDELDPAGLEARLAARPALVIALGTIEWHSHHLPLGLDLLKAQAIAERAADRADAVLAPPAWWAAGGVAFPHTLRLPGELVEPLLAETLRQLAGIGFRAIAVVNGHYGLENSIVVRRAALACDGATVVPLADYELLTDLGARGDHAGVWETSLLWPVRPDLVRVDREGDLPGVTGDDPRQQASREKGEQGLELAAERIAAALERALRERPEPFQDALRAGLAALERLWELRRELGREHAPPVQTPAWLRHLEALRDGDYAAARVAAEAKRADPRR
jgi:creatinine amidohydrolase